MDKEIKRFISSMSKSDKIGLLKFHAITALEEDKHELYVSSCYQQYKDKPYMMINRMGKVNCSQFLTFYLIIKLTDYSMKSKFTFKILWDYSEEKFFWKIKSKIDKKVYDIFCDQTNLFLYEFDVYKDDNLMKLNKIFQ